MERPSPRGPLDQGAGRRAAPRQRPARTSRSLRNGRRGIRSGSQAGSPSRRGRQAGHRAGPPREAPTPPAIRPARPAHLRSPPSARATRSPWPSRGCTRSRYSGQWATASARSVTTRTRELTPNNSSDSRLEIARPAPPRLDQRHRGGGPHGGEHQSRHTATAAEIHDRTRRAADHLGRDVGEASGVLDVRSDGPGPEGAVIASPFEHRPRARSAGDAPAEPSVTPG